MIRMCYFFRLLLNSFCFASWVISIHTYTYTHTSDGVCKFLCEKRVIFHLILLKRIQKRVNAKLLLCATTTTITTTVKKRITNTYANKSYRNGLFVFSRAQIVRKKIVCVQRTKDCCFRFVFWFFFFFFRLTLHARHPCV